MEAARAGQGGASRSAGVGVPCRLPLRTPLPTFREAWLCHRGRSLGVSDWPRFHLSRGHSRNLTLRISRSARQLLRPLPAASTPVSWSPASAVARCAGFLPFLPTSCAPPLWCQNGVSETPVRSRHLFPSALRIMPKRFSA